MCKPTMYKRARIPMFLWERRACANSGAQAVFSSPPQKRPGGWERWGERERAHPCRLKARFFYIRSRVIPQSSFYASFLISTHDVQLARRTRVRVYTEVYTCVCV